MALKRPQEDDDYDFKPTSRKKRAVKAATIEQKAEVTKLAADSMLADQNSTSEPAVEARILERIRKCLAKANHPGTPEAEAKAAFRMGSKLMAQHNITQAQAFEKDMENDQARLGGESVVKITAVSKDRKVLNLAFAGPLAGAMEIFFDCRCYSTTGRTSIRWTFYGIATNTAAAALGFEMAYNLTLDWASSKKGISVRNSYRLGVAEGLIDIAEAEKAEEATQAKESERSATLAAEKSAQAQRAKEIDRLNFQDPGEEGSDESNGTSDSSDDEYPDALENVDTKNPIVKDENKDEIQVEIKDKIKKEIKEEDEERFVVGADFEDGPDEPADFLSDFETELKKNLARETTPPVKTWESEMQLTLFRAKAGAIADEYLQKKNIKLCKGRKSSVAKDYAAFKQGKKDSHKVDVRRKKIDAA